MIALSRRLILTLLVLSAVATNLCTSAFAENPQALKLGGGSPTFPIKVSSISAAGEKPRLETALGTITCEKDKLLGAEITSLRSGVAAGDLEGCVLSTNSEKCTSAGDAVGVILLGTTPIYLVAYKTGTELLAGLLVLSISVEYACGAVHVKKTGGIIALIGPLNVDATNVTLLFDHTGVIQKPTSCEVPVAVCLPGGKTALYSILANLGAGLEHAILILKQAGTIATDLLIDA